MFMTLVGAGRTRHLTKSLPLAVGLLPQKPQQDPAHALPLLRSAAGHRGIQIFFLSFVCTPTPKSADTALSLSHGPRSRMIEWERHCFSKDVFLETRVL